MLLGRGKGTAFARPKAGTIDQMAADAPLKKIVDVAPVRTPTTIMDSMPTRPKFNQKSKRILPNSNKVFTIEGVKKGIAPKEGNTNSIFKGDDGYLRSGVDATPMTKGRFGTYRAAQEIKRGMLPPQLRAPVQRTPVIDDSFFSDAMAKDGGKIVKTEKGGKAVRVKKKSIQIRGFGKARK